MTHPRLIAATMATTTVLFGVASAGAAAADPPGDKSANQAPGPPVVSMTTPEVVEGTGGANEMLFTLELDRPAAGGETLRFSTDDGQGSAMPIEDHEPVLTHPVFEAGATELAVAVPLVTDDVPEANEHILVTMDQPEGLTIANGTGDGTGVIVDDDIPTISVDDVSLPEGSGGPTGFHFTVSLSEPSTVDVYVSATPTAGTASSPADWQALPQLVQFSPGETTHDLVVSVVGDFGPEADETFTVELSDADYASIDDPSGLGTILDDDEDDNAGSSENGKADSGKDGADTPSTGQQVDAGGRPARPPTTTTTVRTAELDASLSSADDPAPGSSGLRLVPAMVALGLAAVSILGAWWLTQR